MTRQIALLVNPTAGRGHAHRVLEQVRQRLAAGDLSVDLLVGDGAEHATELARQAAADGLDTVVALGGDGMVRCAVQGLAGTSTRLGVVPLGTGNDFARSLGIPTQDPLAAADVVVRGQARTIDLGRSREAGWFATVLAAGFDAAVNARANAMRWPHGELRYTLATFSVIRRWAPVPYELTIDGVRHDQEAMLLAVANTDSYGGGLRLAAEADPADGLFDVMIVKPVSKIEFLKVFPQVRSGAHMSHPAVEVLRGRTVSLSAPDITAYADGDPFGTLPLEVECVPGALSVLA